MVEAATLTLPEMNQEEGSSTSFLDPTDASLIAACKALYRRGQAKAGGKKGYNILLIGYEGSVHYHSFV